LFGLELKIQFPKILFVFVALLLADNASARFYVQWHKYNRPTINGLQNILNDEEKQIAIFHL